MNKSRAIPSKSGVVYEDMDQLDALDHYKGVLEDYDNLGRQLAPEETRPKQRRSLFGFTLGGRSSSLPFVSPLSSEKDPSSRDEEQDELVRAKSDLPETTPTVTSSFSSSCSPDHDVSEVSSLTSENKRLRMHIEELERQTTDEAGVGKLTRKIRILKSKRKEDKKNLMRMDKHVKAHAVEIDGLRRELSKALDAVDDLRKDRSRDKAQISKLTKQLDDAHLLRPSPVNSSQLEMELNETTKDLERTKGQLEAERLRISELEAQLEKASRTHDSDTGTMQMKSELRQCQADCIKLQRRNRMLELLVQELEDATSKDDTSESEEEDIEDDLSQLDVPSETASSFEKELESFTLEGSQATSSLR